MGVVVRKDSPFFWFNLERPGKKPLRESTMIPLGATSAQRKQNRTLAELAYNSRMTELAQARFNLPGVTNRAPRFDEFAKWYQDNYSSHKRSVDREKYAIKGLIDAFGTKTLDEIEADDIREWMRLRTKQVTASTVNRQVDILKAIFTAAVPKHLKVSPIVGMRRLRIVKRTIPVLEPADEAKFLAAAPTAPDRAFLVCAIDSLVRLSDLLNLTWLIDRGDHFLIENPKVAAYKPPISRRLRKELDAQKARVGNSKLIFPHVHDYHKPVVYAQRMFAATCKAAGIPHGRDVGGITFHSLRHTGATRMIRAGVDLRTVMAIGGWTSLKSVVKYLKPDEATVEAVNRISGARAVHAGKRKTRNKARKQP